VKGEGRRSHQEILRPEGWLLRLNPQDCHRANTVESYDLIGGAREKRLLFDTCLEVGRVHTLPAFSVFQAGETRGGVWQCQFRNSQS
jgi:hypothetical protein